MKGASRFVAACFVVSILAAIGLFVTYAAGGQTQVEGALLFLALGGVGVGLLAWALRLMAGIGDETQSRRHGRPPSGDAEAATDTVLGGVDQMRRRRFLSRLLAGAAGALGLAALFPIRSLGEAPGDTPFATKWSAGKRLVDVDGALVTKDTLDVGSFTTVFPEDAVGSFDSQAVLIRVEPDLLQLPPERAAWAPEGLVAYSKVCTHAGCPLGLYLAAVHQLRCPCHQSTFDVLRSAEPIYGPAARALPQLPIQIDDDGTIVALDDFTEPIGPPFWDIDTRPEEGAP